MGFNIRGEWARNNPELYNFSLQISVNLKLVQIKSIFEKYHTILFSVSCLPPSQPHPLTSTLP